MQEKSAFSSTVKLCISGLSIVEARYIKEEMVLRKNLNIEFLEDDTLHPLCTHLITKTRPQLNKTEKVLSALARGIPILDVKYAKTLLRLNDVQMWQNVHHISQYDIGGKKGPLFIMFFPCNMKCNMLSK